MEARKRKQADADVVSRRQKLKKAISADKRDEKAVTEDEVEEFFAILRRIHVAVTHFRNATGGGTKYMDGGLRAVLESNEEEDGDAKKKENVGWDLNADPEPECDLN
ncbi:hypothetical protein M0R45_000908 [Rubus argutus]|uniref:Uncharacterized protein n=1 Tax=Rubus argutus TaxID=59490 RepID=A0AAW1VLY8_RUBAR